MHHVDKHHYIKDYLIPDRDDVDDKTAMEVYQELLSKWSEDGSIYYYEYEDCCFSNPNDDYTKEIRGEEITFKDIKEFVEWAQS